MNYDELLKIISDIKKVNPMQAKKLSKLSMKLMDEKDEVKKTALEQKIRSSIYWLFISLLDSDSRYRIYNYGMDIFEECTMIENDARNGWIIGSKGAFRYVAGKNNEAVLANKVPREYKRGFYLVNGSGIEAVEFLDKYNIALQIIARRMDEREETITFTKKAKNKNIPNELLEEMIDFLSLPRAVIDEDRSLIEKEFIK